MTSLGIVGTGYWGKKVLVEAATLHYQGELSEVSVCDSNPTRLAEALRLAPPARACTDYAGFLRNRSMEFVYVATSNDTHFELAREALEAGKHVLIEKPMTTNSREALELLELAQDSSLRLAVGHIFRFNNAIRTVKSLMAEKSLGRVLSFHLYWTAMMEPFTDRTVVWDLAPHPLDILSFIQDEAPESVWAIGRPVRSSQIEETTISLGYPSGAIATMTLSWATPLRRRTLQIECSDGQVLAEAAEQEISLRKTGGESIRLNGTKNNTVRDQLLHFIGDRAQTRPIVNGAGEGFRVVHQIEAIHRSLELRSQISYRLPEVAI